MPPRAPESQDATPRDAILAVASCDGTPHRGDGVGTIHGSSEYAAGREEAVGAAGRPKWQQLRWKKFPLPSLCYNGTMPLVKLMRTPREEEHPLIRTFLDQEEREDFPFKMSLDALEKLKSSCSDEKELHLYMLEDIVFSSIYATFYEAIFVAIKNNPQWAAKLAEQFEKSSEERERLIAEQSDHHVNFILNSGDCRGCPSCRHHGDVQELIPHWERGNWNFFLTLYLGMQTIQFSMEHLLYEVVPYDETVIPLLEPREILGLRQFLYRYVETHS